MTTINECLVCRSTSLTRESEALTVEVPYGAPEQYESVFFRCNTCKAETSTDEMEKEEAYDRAILKSVHSMLDHLNKEEGLSSAHFERCLRIPQRTTARWKDGNISAAAVALLRIVRTYPWLLRVSDANFSEQVSHQVLVAAATLAEPQVFPGAAVANVASTPPEMATKGNESETVLKSQHPWVLAV